MTTLRPHSTIASMKRRLRVEMKERLAGMSPRTRADKSYAACRKLTELPEFVDADVLMMYLPIPQEVDPAEIALHAWQAQKTVVAPKVNWDQHHMLAVRIQSLSDDIVTGKFGVPEPAEGPVWPVEDIDLIIVPALAYDRGGARLGRGGGFYDRLLSEPGARAITCGLGFSEQLIDKLPADKHDQPVDILVTDTEVLRFANKPGSPGSTRPKEGASG